MYLSFICVSNRPSRRLSLHSWHDCKTTWKSLIPYEGICEVSIVPFLCCTLYAVVHYLHLVQIWDNSVSFIKRYTLHFTFGGNDWGYNLLLGNFNLEGEWVGAVLLLVRWSEANAELFISISFSWFPCVVSWEEGVQEYISSIYWKIR